MTPDPIAQQLTTGLELFEQLKELSIEKAALAVVDALSVEDLRAIVLANVRSFQCGREQYYWRRGEEPPALVS